MSQGQQNLNYAISPSSKVSQIFAGDYAACDEGSFFTASLAGTATTTSITTKALGDAAPVLVIQNQQPAGGYNIYLRHLKAVITSVPTSASVWNYSSILDPISTKLTTAGTVMTAVNANAASGVLSKSYINGGAPVTLVGSAQSRQVGQGQISGAIPVAFDEYYFTFGQPGGSIDSIGTQTLVKRLSVPHAPVIIAPGWFFTLAMWGTSNGAAPSIALELGFVERPAGQ